METEDQRLKRLLDFLISEDATSALTLLWQERGAPGTFGRIQLRSGQQGNVHVQRPPSVFTDDGANKAENTDRGIVDITFFPLKG